MEYFNGRHGIGLSAIIRRGVCIALVVSSALWADGFRSYHIGNSLTDSQGELTKLLAHAAGHTDHHNDRHTIPGAPIGWIYNHPESGFGTHYPEALDSLPPPPWDHITLQPFIGHSRSPSRRAHYSKLFYEFAINKSPDIQLWHYFQYRSGKSMFDYATQQLFTLDEWIEVMRTCYGWHEAGYLATDDSITVHKPLAIPCDLTLIRLCQEVKAGNMPGISTAEEFFPFMFGSDGFNIHMTEEGRYFTALSHFACYYKEDPRGLPTVSRNDPLNITSEQLAFMQQIVWDIVQAYPYTGILNTSDTQDPSSPTGVAVADLNYNGVTLSWDAASDNEGILGYELFMDGSRRAFTDTTSISFTNWAFSRNRPGMDPNESHTYQVRTVDVGGNASPLSEGLEVTTLDTYSARDATGSADVVGEGGFYRITARGGSLEWSDVSETAGTAMLKIHYTNSDTLKLERPCVVIVNGATVDTVSFEPTIPYQNLEWKIASVPVELQDGTNTVRLEALSDDGSAEIDNIAFHVNPTVAAAPHAPASSRGANRFAMQVRSGTATVMAPEGSVLRVYDMRGRCVFSRGVRSGQVSVDTHHLRRAAYVLEVESATGTWSERLILR